VITCKTPEEVQKMRASGRVTARALQALVEAVRPGVTTKEIDRIAEDLIRSQGGEPAFLGYQGFKGSVCSSVNEEVVHGIPGGRVLSGGDLLKIDIGSLVDGWYSDMACTVPVGEISDEARRLVETTEESLRVGIGQVRAGAHISDIGHAVQSFVEGRGYSVVRALVGHGIGSRSYGLPGSMSSVGGPRCTLAKACRSASPAQRSERPRQAARARPEGDVQVIAVGLDSADADDRRHDREGTPQPEVVRDGRNLEQVDDDSIAVRLDDGGRPVRENLEEIACLREIEGT